ncbi:MAG: hypothetical protein FWH27_05705 [Planctomycetaceae bacterium]|nr:hypothetical protein [Planctomycetaceae bacterium]
MTETQPEKSGSIFDVKWNDASEFPTAAEYRTISVPSILALLFGLLTPLVLINWGFVFLPILALIFAFLALFLIARSEGMRFGKPLAWAAIFLSLSLVVANVSLWEAYKSRMIREAIDFAGSYFQFVANAKDNPEIDILNIRDMRSPYWLRSVAPSEDRWKTLDKDMFAQEDLSMFTSDVTLRTLMELGHRAGATYYQVKSYTCDKGRHEDYVTLVYAVTYENDKREKETFFVDITVKRSQGEDTTTVANQKKKMGGWAVQNMKGPVMPKEFEDKGDS